MFKLFNRVTKLEKRVNDVIRLGTIKEINLENNLVIVDLGNNLETPPLPYLVSSSGNASVYFVPKMGDQVVVLSKNGDIAQSIILSSVYKGNVAGVEDEWRLEFAQGSIKYKEGKLEINSSSEVTINSPKASIMSDQIILAGEDGDAVVCRMHKCSFTGAPHAEGSSKIKGAL